MILGLCVYAPGALALPPDPTDSPTWVTFDSFDYELQNATEVYIQGSRTDGGCGWTEPIESQPIDEGVIEGREIGIDTATCLVQVQYGTPPASAVEDAFGAPLVGPPTKEPAAQNKLLDSDSLAVVTNRGVAAFKVAWEDPFGIDVNSITAQTDWHWNGNCVVSPVSNTHEQDFFQQSGWWKVAGDLNKNWNCTETTSSSFAHFANDDFCPGGGNRTHAYYDRVVIHGRYTGSATRSHNSWVNGGCSGFLSKVWIFCVDSPIGGDTDCSSSI